MNQVFVADSSDPDLANWFEKKKFFDKHVEDEANALKAAAEVLSKKRDDHWNEIWNLLQVKGVISKDKRRDDYSMSCNIKAQQLFIELQDRTSGLPPELKELLKHMPGAIVEIHKKDDE